MTNVILLSIVLVIFLHIMWKRVSVCVCVKYWQITKMLSKTIENSSINESEDGPQK